MQLARLKIPRNGNYIPSEVNFDQYYTWDWYPLIPTSDGLLQDGDFSILVCPDESHVAKWLRRDELWSSGQ